MRTKNTRRSAHGLCSRAHGFAHPMNTHPGIACVEMATTKAQSLRSLDQFGLRRTQTGYYYIAHYYPLRAMKPIEACQTEELVNSIAGNTFETYLHFPFCEVKCSF